MGFAHPGGNRLGNPRNETPKQAALRAISPLFWGQLLSSEGCPISCYKR